MVEIIEGDVPQAHELEALFGSVGWAHYVDSADELDKAIERCAWVASARRDGRLVAFARAVSDDYSIAYLQDILVDPDFQRSGLGKRLVDAFLARFDQVRMKILLTDDEDAQHRFYESVGFRNTASIEEFKLPTFVRFFD